MTANVSQVEANTAIDPAAFSLDAPPDAGPLTLAQLRESGPLGVR
jgi:hypothetical protein